MPWAGALHQRVDVMSPFCANAAMEASMSQRLRSPLAAFAQGFAGVVTAHVHGLSQQSLRRFEHGDCEFANDAVSSNKSTALRGAPIPHSRVHH